jgi:cob(I)alamin adenosyltransferase
MVTRLSKITTRTGDDGTTGLGDGSRVSKTDMRIQAMGDIDELNSSIGVVVAYLQQAALDHAAITDIHTKLIRIQHDLFDLGGELCMPQGYALLREDILPEIDGWIEQDNQTLNKLKEFILPGGCIFAAHLHVSRSICRRAERNVLQLKEIIYSKNNNNNANNNDANIRDILVHYLNRLSDWLFIISRRINQIQKVADVLWQR